MTESTTTGNSSKRRRVADGLLHCRRLSDLPIEPLTHVATFLAAPSRAIFAVALTTVHHSFQGDGDGISAQKIAGFEWDTLDFGHIEKELAERLSDDDINAILRCIDAVHKLKILKLTNCINITGVGLEPLRGSRIIAKIDMSLVGEHKSPLLNPEPPISRDVVLPILDSILDGEGSALKQIQFPKKWRILNNRFHPSNQDFYRFIRRFNEIMESHGAIRCPDCNGEVGYRGFCEVSVSQTSTCFACSKQECNDCESTRGLEGTLLICSTCEKCYCSDCSTMYVCRHCQHDFCRACSPPVKCSGSECDDEDNNICGRCRRYCHRCQRLYCRDCRSQYQCDVCYIVGCSECISYHECENCYIGHCDECTEKAGINTVYSCRDCGREQCISCRLRLPYPAERSCSGCFDIIAKPWLEGGTVER